MKQILEEAQLLLAADKWGLEALAASRTAARRDHAERSPCANRQGLALKDLVADGLEPNGAIRRAIGSLVDKQPAGRGGGLQAGCGVDKVARDHPLAGGPDDDGGVPRADGSTEREWRLLQLRPQCGNGLGQLETGSDRSFGIVFMCGRRAPHGNDRIADELVNRAAVADYDLSGGLEVPRQKIANILRIAAIREVGETNQVREEHGNQAALSGGWDRRRLRLGGRLRCDRRAQRPATLAAKALPGLVGGAASGTCDGQRRPTLGAELTARSVFPLTAWTDHRSPPQGESHEGSRSNRLLRYGVGTPSRAGVWGRRVAAWAPLVGGRRSTKVLPLPSSLNSSLSEPPCRSASSRLMKSPNPVPGCGPRPGSSMRKKRSKTLSCFSRAMPTPRSSMISAGPPSLTTVSLTQGRPAL